MTPNTLPSHNSRYEWQFLTSKTLPSSKELLTVITRNTERQSVTFSACLFNGWIDGGHMYGWLDGGHVCMGGLMAGMYVWMN